MSKISMKSFACRINPGIKIIILEIIMFIGLGLSFTFVIVPCFSYMGFKLQFVLLYFFISILIAAFFIFVGYFLKPGFLSIIWHFILNLSLLPNLIYFSFSSGNIKPVIGYIILLTVLLPFSNITLKQIKGPHISLDSNERNMYILLLIILVLIVPYLYYLPYINWSNLFLKDIYVTRNLFRNLPKILGVGYLSSPIGRIMLPALLVVSYEKKKWSLVVLIFILTLYLFLATGALKSIFFGLFAVILFYFGDSFRSKLKIFLILFILLLYLGIAEATVLHSSMLSDLFIRRLFFVPPYLEDVYYSYFSGDYLFYSHSFLSKIIHYPYSEPITRYMGDYVFHKAGLNANVGVIPDGYISLGWFGVIIHSIIISFSFLFIRSLNIPVKYFGLFFVYIYYMNTALIGPYFITHGFLFLLVFSYFFLRNNTRGVL